MLDFTSLLYACCLNVNGLRGVKKKDWIKELIDVNSPMFIGIQESKLVNFDQSCIRSIWPHNYVAFASSDSVGASGGILTIVGERSGCAFNVAEANSFNDFISRMGLFDFPLCGMRFTRFYKEGKKASNLDRSYSNHCPIMLKVGSLNFGPKPYKVFDKWIGDKDFLDIISKSWALSFSTLSPDLHLKNKIKKLRLDIKAWTISRLSTQKRDKDTLIKNLSNWDLKAEDGRLTDADILKREEWLMDLSYYDQLHREDLKQKGRLKWAVEGDKNTCFFHSIIKNRCASFSIKGIYVNGAWIDTPDAIKLAAMDHFAVRFKELNIIRPPFSSQLFKRLSPYDASYLESTFSLDEVKAAVKIGDARHFESTGKLAGGCNPSFIVHIPKKTDPLSFSDYRPISLIRCVYKVISKLLALRLAKVTGSVISPNQSAFIEGRQILDGCLIANEIIRMLSLEKLKLLLFKVNFEKAFDSVNWNFLLDVMRQMGFGSKWRKWIASCLSSASISVLINGSPSNEFKMERGLRQGDPLSPFLFLLVVEGLQVIILEACNKGIFKGVSLAESGANISLLQYADDALFFGEWSRFNAKNLTHILKCFELGSGLKVKFLKSKLFGIGILSNEVEARASSLGFAHDVLLFLYLGLPVGKRMGLCDGWNEVINRCRDRLSSWKAKSLSVGGRLTLIKSILDKSGVALALSCGHSIPSLNTWGTGNGYPENKNKKSSKYSDKTVHEMEKPKVNKVKVNLEKSTVKAEGQNEEMLNGPLP
ncbi:putative RNA-directed DNA polymerase [Tanacetum coccineum]